MTVSELLGLERTVMATEARRLMDAAQAAVYPHVKPDAARRLWSAWERMASPPRPMPAAGSLFSWNGRPVTPIDLKRQLSGHLGAGLTA